MSLSHSSLITPCLWFDSEGEEAAKFYTSIFPDSEIGQVSYYTEVGSTLFSLWFWLYIVRSLVAEDLPDMSFVPLRFLPF